MDQQLQKGFTFLRLFGLVSASPPCQCWGGTEEMFILAAFPPSAGDEGEGCAHTLALAPALHLPQAQETLPSGQFLTCSTLPKQQDPH